MILSRSVVRQVLEHRLVCFHCRVQCVGALEAFLLGQGNRECHAVALQQFRRVLAFLCRSKIGEGCLYVDFLAPVDFLRSRCHSLKHLSLIQLDGKVLAAGCVVVIALKCHVIRVGGHRDLLVDSYTQSVLIAVRPPGAPAGELVCRVPVASRYRPLLVVV